MCEHMYIIYDTSSTKNPNALFLIAVAVTFVNKIHHMLGEL